MSAARGGDAALAAEIAAGFAAKVRRAGIEAPLSAVLAFAKALLALPGLERAGVYWAGRSVFVHSPDEVEAYDEAFAAFFVAARDPAGLGLARPVSVPGVAATEAGEEADAEVAGASGLRFSPAERLARADLAELSAEELEEAQRLVAALAAAPPLRETSRTAPSARASAHLDLRRTVALALRSDGEVLARRYRRPRRRARRVAVLCDVSGSMQPYARAMLRFAQALAAGAPRVEVFALGTRLTRLTRTLGSRDVETALRGAGEEIVDWSGGTRLGETLREFNDRHGVRSAARSAVVVICSDGIDRGDPELIASEMARLSRVAHRIVWVNPLKSSPGYEPLARGMAAALPFVDEFLPGESYAALERVASALAS